MEIVIDIPKEMIISIEQGSFGAKYNMYDIVGCVVNGTPLPEHHERLIDADELLENASQVYDAVRHMWTPDFVVNADDIDSAPTIIKGSESE